MKATLYVQTGQKLGTVDSMAVELMFDNGKPPEVLVWGDRVFYLFDKEEGKYMEGMAWYLTNTANNRVVLT